MRNTITISNEKRFTETKQSKLEALLERMNVAVWCKQDGDKEYLPTKTLPAWIFYLERSET